MAWLQLPGSLSARVGRRRLPQPARLALRRGGGGHRRRAGGGGGGGGQGAARGALRGAPCSRAAQETWFPAYRNCNCCKGYIHGTRPRGRERAHLTPPAQPAQPACARSWACAAARWRTATSKRRGTRQQLERVCDCRSLCWASSGQCYRASSTSRSSQESTYWALTRLTSVRWCTPSDDCAFLVSPKKSKATAPCAASWAEEAAWKERRARSLEMFVRTRGRPTFW